jgi:hypothetical protein
MEIASPTNYADSKRTRTEELLAVLHGRDFRSQCLIEVFN